LIQNLKTENIYKFHNIDVDNIILICFQNIKELIKKHNYKKIYYLVNKDGNLDTKGVSNEVLKFINDQLKELGTIQEINFDKDDDMWK